MKHPAFALAVLSAGCALGPDYRRPAVDMPAQYRDVDSAAADNAAGGSN